MPGHDLRSSPGLVDVPWAVVRVHGPDAVSYLQGQLSQDVTVEVGTTSWTFLLAPTGKVDAWLRITRLAEDDYLLDAPAIAASVVSTRLERFKLRTKVDIDVLPRRVWSFRGPGAAAQATAACVDGDLVCPAGWPGVDGADLITARQEAPVGAIAPLEAWHALRIECGVPLNGAELGPDTIPAEAGRWVIEASVSFTKGCYTGQELVARIDSRGGNVPRPILALVLDDGPAPPPGAMVEVAGKQVGTLGSAAVSPVGGVVGLGPIARSVEPGTEVELRWDSGSTRGTVAVPPLR